MRVALVSDWCLPRQGGIETHLQALAKRLIGAGVKATVLTSYPGEPLIDGVPIDRVETLRLPVEPIALSPDLVGRLKASLAAGRYDLVHVHASIVAPFCLAALPAAKSLGLPVLLTFHSVMNALPTVLRALDAAFGWTGWDVTPSAVSQVIAGQLDKVFPDRMIEVLPNGFDAGFWRAGSPVRDDARPFTVVSAMRLQRRKRPLALLDIFAQAVSRMGETGARARLTIAGDGPGRKSMERRVRALGLGAQVDLPGWCSRDDLRRAFNGSDVFVMPSTKEAFCIAALEARAAGLPVVARAGTGIADFIRDGETGFLCDSDAAIAAALAELEADPGRLAALAGAEDRLERYDWAALLAEHLALYRRCVRSE